MSNYWTQQKLQLYTWGQNWTFFFSSVFLFVCQSISKAQFSIKFSRLQNFHKWLHSSEKALRDHKEHLLLYPLSITKLLLMPRRTCAAHTHRPAPWTWRKSHVHAAHIYTKSHIFRHVCTYTPFALSRVQDSQFSQLSQCGPTTTPLPDPAAICFAMEPLVCENKLQAQAPTRNLQWVS